MLDRVREVQIGGTIVPFVSPGDLVVLKLIAGRPKDNDDARTVVQAQKAALKIDEVRSLLTSIEVALDQSDLVSLFDRMIEA